VSGLASRLYNGETNIDFVGRRRIWYLISAVMIIASIVSLSTRGLNYGIEFKGGVSITAPISESGPLGDADSEEVVAEVEEAVSEFVDDAQIQVQQPAGGGERQVLVQTKIGDTEAQDDIVGAVSEAVGASETETSSDRIGSKWGGEVTNKAVRALIIFMVVIVAFISYRFEWKMAVGALAALIHDLVITAGVYSMVGFSVTPSSVIAILTILGYSLYDTVVVFDKVEENTAMFAATGKMTYQDSANLAMNQVFMRSLNTTLATLLPVAALLFVGAGVLGAGTLKDLSLALFVGLLLGAYSSIFIAVPILAQLKESEPRYRSIREKVLRDAKKTGTTPGSLTPQRAAETLGTSGGAAVGRRKSEVAAGDGASVDDAEMATATQTARPAGARPTSKSSKAKTTSKKAKRRRRR
jgi:preprotein translocase subunit SecF